MGVFQIQDGNITMGGIIAASLLNGRIIAPVTQIVMLAVKFELSLLSFHELNNFMSLPIEKDEKKTYITKEHCQGKIEFKDLMFKYKENSPLVLDNINLVINPN